MFSRHGECGFIFFETMIGLPLILSMVWAMTHLFIGTWSVCRALIADITMQTEVREAMQRIVGDLRNAYKARLIDNGRLEIIFYLYKGSNQKVYKTIAGSYDEDMCPVYYFLSENGKKRKVIYRQRDSDEKDHPLTGEDLLSDVDMMRFKRNLLKSRLWDIAIEAKSRVSGHSFRLQTKVYTGGAKE